MAIEPRQGWGSLHSSLHGLFSLGRSMGLSDLGTFNASSRLPGGGVSDHAIGPPALAFDLGMTPASGERHPIAWAFANIATGWPGVKYVIVGKSIWSPERGWHAYTAGGHMNHVHVSGTGVGVAAPSRPRTPQSSSASLSRGELAALWVAEGGNPRHAAMAAAVASLESGGRPNARNLSRIEDSRGLWQINVRAHPQYALRDLYNPRVNARAAIAISSNGANWNPWTTAAQARASLGRGAPPDVTRPGGESGGGFGIGSVTGIPGDILGGARDIFGGAFGWVKAIVDLVAFITNPLNWLRMVEVLFGFTLMLSGLAMLAAVFGSKSPTVGRLSRLTPAGRVGAAVRRGAG